MNCGYFGTGCSISGPFSTITEQSQSQMKNNIRSTDHSPSEFLPLANRHPLSQPFGYAMSRVRSVEMVHISTYSDIAKRRISLDDWNQSRMTCELVRSRPIESRSNDVTANFFSSAGVKPGKSRGKFKIVDSRALRVWRHKKENRRHK
jgi:hypothetical protein